jgi:hypothetical protein
MPKTDLAALENELRREQHPLYISDVSRALSCPLCTCRRVALTKCEATRVDFLCRECKLIFTLRRDEITRAEKVIREALSV